MHTASCLSSSAPTRPDIESFTPSQITNMSLETFEAMTYREQLIFKRHWPDAYDRLIRLQEEKRDAKNRRY